ncbi:hypothetical protein [Chitinolyticbacter meiyuanensis]|uniref:hypothetical protein n=1 Tax=Chitinolyticbacter meiyuanensis TaxID=682798 RepID=UPI0011E5C5C7|nr:hypothetical protein [Chitinolyticbacter meiyuanensis]
MPDKLYHQLCRLPINVSRPSDLYAYEAHDDGAHCRVIYHLAGKILSGPDAWRGDAGVGKVLVYSAAAAAPHQVGMVVVPSRQTFDARPQYPAHEDNELLQIDLRLFVPHPDSAAAKTKTNPLDQPP